LPLQSIDDIHSGDSLPLGVLSVGDSITNDVFKENLEDTSGLLIDEARDTLDTTSASQTADSGLGDTLDVVTQDFAVTLGASLSESLASFASTSHVEFFLSVKNRMIQNSELRFFYTNFHWFSVREFVSRDQKQRNFGGKTVDPIFLSFEKFLTLLARKS
jgi:hypothetical protein